MKIKRITALFLAAAVMIGSAGGCGGQEKAQESLSQAETMKESKAETASTASLESQASEEIKETESSGITVTDMIGRKVRIVPGSYTRIVCIGAGALRMYSYIGDTGLLCGVEDIDNMTLSERPRMFDSVARPYMIAYGEEFSGLESCGVGGPNAQAAEAEKILSCTPDLVISQYEDVEKEDALQEQLGIPVVTLKAGANGVFDDSFKQSMDLLGVVLDRADRADELVSFIESEAKEISDRTAAVSEEERPGVYICGLGNWGTTNHLMTAQNYISFQIANVKNAVTDLAAPGIQAIEEEKFAALGADMDILIMDAAAVKNIIPLYQEDPGIFDTCKAWQEGEAYLQMAYNAYYTNYETALINTWFIAGTVYPELFEDIDMREKTNEVTRMFLGKELADQIFQCPSSFGGYQKIDTNTFFQ